jgi:hypothetical protein
MKADHRRLRLSGYHARQMAIGNSMADGSYVIAGFREHIFDALPERGSGDSIELTPLYLRYAPGAAFDDYHADLRGNFIAAASIITFTSAKTRPKILF